MHLIKGLRLPAMDPTVIKLLIIAMFEDGVQLLSIKEGHILPALDLATRLQHNKAVMIQMRTRIPTSSVGARLKDTVMRRPLLTLMTMETPSWVECYKEREEMDISTWLRHWMWRKIRPSWGGQISPRSSAFFSSAWHSFLIAGLVPAYSLYTPTFVNLTLLQTWVSCTLRLGQYVYAVRIDVRYSNETDLQWCVLCLFMLLYFYQALPLSQAWVIGPCSICGRF